MLEAWILQAFSSPEARHLLCWILILWDRLRLCILVLLGILGSNIFRCKWHFTSVTYLDYGISSSLSAETTCIPQSLSSFHSSND